MIPGITASKIRSVAGPTSNGLVAVHDAWDYVSGQVWANSIASPADGSNQTDYDFYLGASGSSEGSDPTLVDGGTALAHFNFGGSQYFDFAHPGAVPSFLQTMHHADAKFTIEMWILLSGNIGANVHPYFDSGTGDFGGADTSRGVIFMDLGNYPSNNVKLNFRVKRDFSGVTALDVKSDNIVPINSIQMVSLSYDATGDDYSFFCRNGNYMTVFTSHVVAALDRLNGCVQIRRQGF